MVGKYAAVKHHPHARDRMRKRKISASEVERAIANPDNLTPSASPPGRFIVEQQTMTGATLRVVYVEEATEHGLTAFVLSTARIGR